MRHNVVDVVVSLAALFIVDCVVWLVRSARSVRGKKKHNNNITIRYDETTDRHDKSISE